jgi:hypothetical protein
MKLGYIDAITIMALQTEIPSKKSPFEVPSLQRSKSKYYHVKAPSI